MSSQETAELFSSTERECLEALLLPDTQAAAQAVVHSWIENPPGRLFLGGAGTSGRLAWYLAQRHRSNLTTLGVEITAWIAGGPRALVLAVEGAEDDFEAAYSELRSGLVDDTGFFLGISCGLSAPCVAAGLVAASDLGARSAVFGVNAADEARSTPLPRLDGGFRGCLSAREDDPSFTLISAPVGPELLTGSSRLKGGTATWVLLDAMLSAWLDSDAPGLEGRTRTAFSEAAGIASHAGSWIESAGDCLRRGRSLFYLGRGDEGRAGLLDASECGPTFGARADQIRAFLEGGWAELGAETTNDSPLISRIAFDQDYKDKLQEDDLVFVLGEVECEVSATKIVLPVSGFLPTKLLLNAISTGAFVRSGKVWGNRMIDLALSNHKLFDRACRILEDLRGKPADACYRSLVAAIWGQERPDRDLLRLPVEAHLAQVRAQGGATGYVPLALLHLEGMPLSQARTALDAQPVLRNLLIG